MINPRKIKGVNRFAAIAGMIWLFALGVASCSQPPAPPATAAVSIAAGGDGFNPLPGLITWVRDPNYVLFRAEIAGGEDPFLDRNVIPDCTIYGDNRIVWKNELDAQENQALEDRLSDDAISAFIQYLTVTERIYTFEEKLPDLATQFPTVPVVERVTIAVNGMSHRADGLSGWDAGWFDRVLDTCKSLGQSPVLILPQAGWLSTREVPFDVAPPLVMWDAAATGFSLGEHVGDTPGWVTGQGVAQLWERIHSLPLNSIYQDGDHFYWVALQIPAVTRGSPPTP